MVDRVCERRRSDDSRIKSPYLGVVHRDIRLNDHWGTTTSCQNFSRIDSRFGGKSVSVFTQPLGELCPTAPENTPEMPKPRPSYAPGVLRSGQVVSPYHGNEGKTPRKMLQKGRFTTRNSVFGVRCGPPIEPDLPSTQKSDLNPGPVK
jgi:hypothetical protein